MTKLSRAQIQHALERVSDGESQVSVAKYYKVHVSTVRRYVNAKKKAKKEPVVVANNSGAGKKITIERAIRQAVYKLREQPADWVRRGARAQTTKRSSN